MPSPDVLIEAEVSTINISLEPAFNAINSLMLINKSEHISGLGEWVYQTAALLTQEQLIRNKIVLWGLFYAVEPEKSWPSFPAYLDHIASLPPNYFRDRILNAYAGMRLSEDGESTEIIPEYEKTPIDYEPLLENKDAFLSFLRDRFPPESLDLEVESFSHDYLRDPSKMKSLIITHLTEMWQSFLEPEWNKVKSMVQASANAFRSFDLTQYSTEEALQLILDRDIDDCMEKSLDKHDRIIMIPSAHLGPYTVKFVSNNTLRLLFGLRMPKDTLIDSVEVNRSDLLVRLNALADDNRLRVLRLLFDQGEMRSQEIMEELDLSQSAASRHLKQLSATGYINERRCTGAKCYRMNPDRIESTISAIASFLLEK